MKNINFYQIYRPKSKVFPWSFPFPAIDDDVALSSLKELATNQPELLESYVYLIGKFDISSGKMIIRKIPKLVRSKKNEK